MDINAADNIKMFAANKTELKCIGSATVLLSYYGVVTLTKMYVMNDVSTDYLMLSKSVCVELQILPREFPLPIQRCRRNGIIDPPIDDHDPLFAIRA